MLFLFVLNISALEKLSSLKKLSVEINLRYQNYCHKKLTLFFFSFVYDKIKFFSFDKEFL